jgi:hypothetical protein
VPNPGLREGIRTLEVVETIYRQSGYPVIAASSVDASRNCVLQQP